MSTRWGFELMAEAGGARLFYFDGFQKRNDSHEDPKAWNKRPGDIGPWARMHGDVGILWSHDENIAPIFGKKRRRYLEENIEALSVDLCEMMDAAGFSSRKSKQGAVESLNLSPNGFAMKVLSRPPAVFHLTVPCLPSVASLSRIGLHPGRTCPPKSGPVFGGQGTYSVIEYWR
jgi:hypothetical protein